MAGIDLRSPAGSGSGASSGAALPAANADTATTGTLQVGKHHYISSAGGNVSRALPATANAGDLILLEKSDSSANTVSATGSIRGVGSSTFSLKLQNESILLEADGSNSWWPLTGHKTLASMDVRYVGTATPADVAPRTGGIYASRQNLYTPTGSSLRKIRAKLGLVAAGQTATARAKIAWIGHSEVAGFGASVVGGNDAPVSLRKLLATRYTVGTGVVAVWNNNNQGGGASSDSRWVFDAGWAYAGGAYGSGNIQLHRRAAATGQNATFTSDILGTNVDIYSFSNSAAFSYTIKDNAGTTISSGTVTPTGTNTQYVLSVTGLTNAKTVVLTTTSASATYLVGVNVRPASAAEVSGLGFFGSEAVDWLPSGQGVAQWFNAYNDMAFLAPDLVIVQLDANEALHGKTAATLQTNLTSVVTAAKTLGDVMVVASCQPTGNNSGTGAALTSTEWSTFRNAIYNVADALTVPLVDITDRWGSYATANANGLMYDLNHPNGGGYADTALAVYEAIVA